MEGSIYRLPETHRKYFEKINSGGIDQHFYLKGKPFAEYQYWVMVRNDFPYDQFAEDHLLLFPRRDFQFDEDMKVEEREELFAIKRAWHNTFDTVMENFVHHRTIKGVYHLHFIKFKEKYGTAN